MVKSINKKQYNPSSYLEVSEKNLLDYLESIKTKYKFVKGKGNFQIDNEFFEISYTIKLLKNPPLGVAYDRLEHGETVLDTGYFARKLVLNDLIKTSKKHPFLKLIKRKKGIVKT